MFVSHQHFFSSQPLYGHTDSVTCLAVSDVHNVLVSGSHDLTCILWDMEELSYITQLTGHTASISSLAINDLTVSLPHTLPLLPWCHRLSLLTACTSSYHSSSAVALLSVHLCNPWCLCERVKLRHARAHTSTCGTWRVSCCHTAILPAGLFQTCCPSPSHNATSGTPGTWSSPAVQMASYGWGFTVTLRSLTDSPAVCFWEVFYIFKCSSHYFGISVAATWMSIKEIITTCSLCVCDCTFCSLLLSKLNCKLGFTREWAPIPHVHLTHTYKWYYCCIITSCYGRCVCVVAYASALVIMLNYIWFFHSLCVSHTDMEDRVHQNTITWPSRRARIPRARPNRERR